MNRRTSAAALACLAIAIGLVPLAAPTSHAETVPGLEMGWDKVKDVVVESIPDGATVGTPAVVDPNRIIGDIYHYRITHEPKVVRVSQKYRALPQAGQYNRHEVYIGTGKTALTIEVVAGPGNWLGTKSVRRSGTPVNCPNLYSRIDYAHRMFIVQVPRTCLGNPHWVRVNGTMYAEVDQGDHYLSYADFAFTDGFVDGADLSPKVYEPTYQDTSGPGGLQ